MNNLKIANISAKDNTLSGSLKCYNNYHHASDIVISKSYSMTKFLFLSKSDL